MTTPPVAPENGPDPWLPRRLARLAVIVAGELKIRQAAAQALRELFAAIKAALGRSSMNADVLDNRMQPWRQAVDESLLPSIGVEFGQAFRELIDDAAHSPDPHVTTYLGEVENRLVAVADEVFDVIRAELDTGRRQGESIEELAARIDKVLEWEGERTWENRAITIARTETIGAYNSGQFAGARELADLLGVQFGAVRKRWLATDDTRTRPTHRAADGQTVPAEEMFRVGESWGLIPHDPRLPADEVVNCRCTPLFLFPGDPGYDEGLRADGSPTMADEPTNTGKVVVLLPAADDPVHGIGDEQKHVTMAWLGKDEIDAESVLAEVARVAAEGAPFSAAVSGRGELGPDLAKVLFVESEDLMAGRGALVDGETIGRLVAEHDTHPNFLPHLTLTYGEMPAAARDITEIRFDRLALWNGDDQTEYPLGETVTESTTAAGFDEETDVPVMAVPMPESRQMWHGVIVPEGRRSGDRRVFAPGALRTRVLPLPLRWQEIDAPGHDGAVVVGNIEGMRRAANGEVRGWGYMHTGEDAWKVIDLIENRMLRGVSVDGDDLESSAFEMQHTDGTPFDLDNPQSDPVSVFTDARVASATICPIPAFEEAFVALGAPPLDWYADGEPLVEGLSEEREEALVAAGHSSAYADPKLTGPTPLTVTEDGRVFGHVATWGTCHIGFNDTCVTAPKSSSGYAYFTTGEVITADGVHVPVGQITLGTGHAGASLSARPAAAHYDNTGTAAADVAIGEDSYGIWIAGMCRDGLPAAQVEQLRAAAVSGDWRRIGGSMELVAALGVNVPGFPIPRTAASVSHGQQVALVASGIVSPATIDDMTDRAARGAVAIMQRASRVEQAAARVRALRVSAASLVMTNTNPEG